MDDLGGPPLYLETPFWCRLGLLGAPLVLVPASQLEVGSRAGDMTLMFADRFPELSSFGGQ